MKKISIQLQDVSGLSYFFTYLILRNQALLYSYRDSDSEVRYHLAYGKRDDFSGYALRQGEIRSNNIMELASLILENDHSSFEVLFPLLCMRSFSLDKQKAAATFVFWTRYNGFRSSVSLICEAYLLNVAAFKTSYARSVMVLFTLVERTIMLDGLYTSHDAFDGLHANEFVIRILQSLVIGSVKNYNAAQDVWGTKSSIWGFVSAFKHSLVTESRRMHKLSPLSIVVDHILVILFYNGEVMKIKSAGLHITTTRAFLNGSLSKLQEDYYSDFSLLELEVDLSLLLLLCASVLPPVSFFACMMKGTAEDGYMDRTRFFFDCQVLLQDVIYRKQEEAAYTSLVAASWGLDWFSYLLVDLHIPLADFVVLSSGNQAVMVYHNLQWKQSFPSASLQGMRRAFAFIDHMVVAGSGWFWSILDLLYCSLPRPPESSLCKALIFISAIKKFKSNSSRFGWLVNVTMRRKQGFQFQEAPKHMGVHKQD
ncbi:hypothetical protein N665_0262s0015 [Sinapis alba]|nr:hypothetical protein N665_0262s0015 [Sinapis alba]